MHGGDRGGKRRSGPDEGAGVVVGEGEAGGGESERAGNGNGIVGIGGPNDGVGNDMGDEEEVVRGVGFRIGD